MESLTGEKRKLCASKEYCIYDTQVNKPVSVFSNLWWTHQFPIVYTGTKYYFCLNKTWLISIKMFIWNKSRLDKRRQWFWPLHSEGVSTTG